MTILELRQKAGLSQSKFAKRFHLNVRTVQTWEQGTRKTPDYVIWLITRVIELEEKINVKRDGI
jgi:putative transcriptional regulator